MGEWRRYSVSDIAAGSPSALATGPFGSSISSRFFTLSGIPVIRGGNLSADVGTRLDETDLVFVSTEKAREFRRSIVRVGDLIFTCWGTVNQIGIVSAGLRHREFVISNKQMKLTPDPTKADSLFLYYLFSSPALQDQLSRNSIGSSVPGFNLGQLREMQLVLPEPSEQRAIARILGALDDKIELNRRMSATLEEMARALFRSWFVDFDPVHAKAEGRDPGLPAELFPDRFEESELGEVPVGWEVGAIDDLAAIVGGSTPSTNNTEFWAGGTHWWVTPKDLSASRSLSLLDSERRITDAGLAQISSGLLPPGTVLLSSRAPIGYLAIAEVPVAINQGFIALKPAPGVPSLYLVLWCDQFSEDIVSRANGSTFLEISKTSFRTIPTLLPPLPVLEVFKRFAEPLRDRLATIKLESRTLAALRDALLPKLISGELRVPEELLERASEAPAG